MRMIRGGIRALRRASLLLVVLATLVLTVASFAIHPVAVAMVGLTRLLDLTPAVETVADLASMRTRSDRLATQNRQLGVKVEHLERRALKAEARAARLLRDNRALLGKTADLAREIEMADERISRQLREMDRVTARIARRSSRDAARNVASIPLESVPFLGALTIAGVTALEVRDACATVSDMEALRRSSGIPPAAEDLASKTCALVVPPPVLPSEMTIAECRSHADEIRVDLGSDAGRVIDAQCDCLELPDGCPTSEPRIPPTVPPLP